MGLIEEIREQPSVIAKAIGVNQDIARKVADLAGQSTHAVIAARGTSDNAGRYAQYVWGTRNGLSVGLTTPSLFSVYDRPPRLTDALVVGISQSGQSPDIVAVLAEGRRQHRPTVALTNDPGSPLAEEADVVVNLVAGEERSVAATKTYTSTLAMIALISEAIGSNGGSALNGVSRSVAGVLGVEAEIQAAARSFAGIEHCAVLGRGFNHATAFEWALKLQELAQVVAQPFSTADFLHGPVAVVEPGYPILAVTVRGPAHEEVCDVLTGAAAAGARLLTISDDPLTALAGEHITIPGALEEWLTPISAIVAGQLFTYHLTLANGLDPESPRGLKKVTRTT